MIEYYCIPKNQYGNVLKSDAMKLIKRYKYLDRFRNFRGTPDMKIVVGVRRGYDVYVGKVQDLEIDFIAMRGSEKAYIQVSDNIAAQGTFERELAPFAKIRDGYPRMLIARTRNPETDFEGVRIVNLADWLSEDGI